MKQRFVLFACLFVFGTTLAQKSPIKWGKIPAEDLAMTTYTPDPEADAVVLYDYGNIYFDVISSGPLYHLTRTKRIKILKNTAFDRGNVTIPYYDDARTKLTLKAHVIQPDGTVTEVSKKDIIDEKIFKEYSQKRVAIPDITEGCVIEYSYKKTSPYLAQLPTWYFQDDIPVRTSELRMSVPAWFEYARLFQGQDKLTVAENELGTTNISGGRIDAHISRYVAENVEALQEEPYITTMDDYLMRIKFQLSGIRAPGRPYEPYMTTWEGLAEKMLDSEYFGEQFTRKKRVQPIQETIAPVLATLETKDAKIKFIHQYLTQNIEWDGDYDSSIDVNIDKAFELRRGNSAELNLMLLALLRVNDIESYPVLISTRGHGKAIELYPFRSQFNHVLVQARGDDGELKLLDVGNANAPANLLRIPSLNKRGLRIESEEKTAWIDIVPQRSKQVMVADMSLDEEGMITADIQCQHVGYSAMRERSRYASDDTGSYWVDYLEEQAVTAELDAFEYSNPKELEKPLKGKISCTLPEQAQVVDDFIYLSPIFYSGFYENPFKIEKRSFPVEIPYPFNEQVVINLSIPDGYVVEEYPKSIKLSMPNGAGKFMYSISEKAPNQLQIMMRSSVNQLMYMPEEYKGIKDFYDVAAEKLQEQIVLKRA